MTSPSDQPSGPAHINAEPQGIGEIAGILSAWCGLVLVLTAHAYRAMLLTLVVAAALPSLWSWSTYVVRSGSMEPALSVGDVVITKPFTSASRVPLGRVMLFEPPGAAKGQENRLHRVVKRLPDGSYVTAGDANRSNDVAPVPAKNFHGRAIICVPFVGLPLVWLDEGNLTLFIIWALLTLLAFYLCARPSFRARPRHPEPVTVPAACIGGAGRPQVAAGRAALRTISRSGPAAIAMTVAVVASSNLAIQSADTAFSDTTVTSHNTWTVAVATSRATSKIQVYDTPSASGWYQRSSVSVNISATASGGATVRSITYRLNGGTAVTTKSSSLVFTLNKQGDNVVTYFATDSVGGAETAHTAHVKLDDRAPVLTVTSPTGDLTHAQWRAACTRQGLTGGLCGTAVDTSGSGVQRVEFVLFRSSDSRCFNGSSWTSAACQTRTAATLSSANWLVAVPDSALAVSRTWYTITVYSQDVAGNTTNTTRNFSIG